MMETGVLSAAASLVLGDVDTCARKMFAPTLHRIHAFRDEKLAIWNALQVMVSIRNIGCSAMQTIVRFLGRKKMTLNGEAVM